MKVNHFRQMMRYLTRPPDNTVKVRKPNAVPPKTKTIQKFKKGGAPRSKFNQTLGKLRIKDDPDLIFKDVVYDADLGKFVNKKTGEAGTLDYFRDKEIYSAEEAVEKVFEPILDRLQKPKKMIAKKPIKNGDPKPNGTDPNPNVIPFPYDKIEDAPNWYDTFRDPILKMTVEEYLQEKQREYEANLEKNLNEEALKIGIGKLFRKKII
tara:strand:+ start:36 stop:659 length:624 start_codon:yes stop_codon:yes gene_type:complete